MEEIYQSWLNRTSHISGNCSFCQNKRYYFESPITTDRTLDYRPTIYACPACNFEDLQVTKKTDYINFDLFVRVKNGLLSIKDLKY
jgi:hypothetical protein